MTDERRRPVRVRVTASDAGPRARPVTREFALPGQASADAETVFSRGLVRTQLRVALGCVAGFLIVAAAVAAVIFALPALGDPEVFGVPLSWLLHAYAFYPLLLVFAVVYVRTAARNERRFRDLADPEADA